MSSPFLRLMGSAIVVLALAACAQVPPDYSPHYVQVPVVSPDRPHRIVRHELVPEACLVADPTDTQFGTQFGPHLPPGCANNANLLAMVEHKRDVVHGRKLGAAPASPSARAAQKYIYGLPRQQPHGPLGGGVDTASQASGGTAGTSNESVPATTPGH
jgi:type IV pilus biogenesis protein CpaD/CtpE